MNKFVVICTDKDRRGVFGGILVSHNQETKVAVLEQAQMCVKWTSDIGGVVGLAAKGPSEHCRISAPTPRIELDGVSCVMDASDEAKAKWEKQPWG